MSIIETVYQGYGQLASAVLPGFEPAVASFLLGLAPVLLIVLNELRKDDWTNLERRAIVFLKLGFPLTSFLFGVSAAVYFLYDNPLRVALEELIQPILLVSVTAILVWIAAQSRVDLSKYVD